MTIDADVFGRGFGSELAIRARTATTWELTEPLTWTGESQTFTVPAGFVTDFATSPRFLHWLWLPYGAYTRAAVLHDWLLTALAEWQSVADTDIGNAGRPPTNSRDIDGIFRVAMRDLGVGWPKRWMGWTAVRWAALFNPRRAYGRDFAKDAPKVLGMSLLVLPVVLPGAVGVLISLGFVRLITTLSGGRPSIRRTARRRPPAGSSMKGNDHA